MSIENEFITLEDGDELPLDSTETIAKAFLLFIGSIVALLLFICFIANMV